MNSNIDIEALKKVIRETLTEFANKHEGNTSVYKDGKTHTVDEIMDSLEKFDFTQLDKINQNPDKFSSAEKYNPDTYNLKYDTEKIIAEVHSELPSKPMVKLNPIAAKGSVFDSKLGGTPYLPKDYEYPKGLSGSYKDKPLKLLAQLNFEHLPHIEPFPQKGILQFYCSCDNDECVYGMDFDYPENQNGFRIIYHENIIADVSQLMNEADIPEFDTSDGRFPFEKEFILKAEKITQCKPSIHDANFHNLFMEKCSKEAGKELNEIYRLEEEGFGNLEFIFEENANETTCIGGYPFFTQDDVRFKDRYDIYDTLLLQIASFYDKETKDEIMWGDCGIANFFIPADNLKKCDFTKVIFNWDCC